MADLASWRDTATREAIVDVRRDERRRRCRPEERVAVFDNDGTLWCEKPMPIELGFILQRLAEMAERTRRCGSASPGRPRTSKDYAWLGGVITKHYAGDDSDVKVLIGGILQAFAGQDGRRLRGGRRRVPPRRAASDARPPASPSARYLPMVELLRYLEANGFTSYIASGGGRDFMRPITEEVYGIPPERVIGSSNALRYEEDENGGSIVHLAEPDVFDDGPVKPVRIWSRIGRRPILAGGNSNGDIPMLRYAGGEAGAPPARPPRRRRAGVRLHAGAEDSLERARADGWTVVSIKDDWATVFPA